MEQLEVLAKYWIPIGSLLEVLENPLEVLRKAVEKLCAELLKQFFFWENGLGKFAQAILGVKRKQSFIRSSLNK